MNGKDESREREGQERTAQQLRAPRSYIQMFNGFCSVHLGQHQIYNIQENMILEYCEKYAEPHQILCYCLRHTLDTRSRRLTRTHTNTHAVRTPLVCSRDKWDYGFERDLENNQILEGNFRYQRGSLVADQKRMLSQSTDGWNLGLTFSVFYSENQWNCQILTKYGTVLIQSSCSGCNYLAADLSPFNTDSIYTDCYILLHLQWFLTEKF